MQLQALCDSNESSLAADDAWPSSDNDNTDNADQNGDSAYDLVKCQNQTRENLTVRHWQNGQFGFLFVMAARINGKY
jgi:hypothetical protein